MDLISFIKNILTGLGLNEVFTYSLIDKKSLQDSQVAAPAAIGVCNPLSREQEILRPTLTPGLIKCVSYNLNQKQASVSIFEIARVFSLSGSGVPLENLTLGVALSGERIELLGEGQLKDRFGMLHLKGVVEVLFQRLGIRSFQFFPRGSSAADVIYGGKKIGAFLNIKKSILESFDIKNRQVVVAELSLDEVLKQVNLGKKFVPLPLYPGISRDISLILKHDVSAADLLALIRDEAGSLLGEARISDYYHGQQIPGGSKGITVSCFYRSGERTLTEEEINPLHKRVCRALEEKLEARFR
jgi:phenylalanyl-tRNA synthetase beta chain